MRVAGTWFICIEPSIRPAKPSTSCCHLSVIWLPPTTSCGLLCGTRATRCLEPDQRGRTSGELAKAVPVAQTVAAYEQYRGTGPPLHQETNRGGPVVSISQRRAEHDRRIRGNAHDPIRTNPVAGKERSARAGHIHSYDLWHRFVMVIGINCTLVLPCFMICNRTHRRGQAFSERARQTRMR